jgi:hypothetical protein
MSIVSDRLRQSFLVEIAHTIWEGEFEDAIPKIFEMERIFGIITSTEASFLLSKTGSDFSKPRILTLLFSRGGRMTNQFMISTLRDTLIHKAVFSRRLAKAIASHFMQDQIEDAEIWFDGRKGFPISHQVKYSWFDMPPFRPMPNDIVSDYPRFRPNPDACVTELLIDALIKPDLDLYTAQQVLEEFRSNDSVLTDTYAVEM